MTAVVHLLRPGKGPVRVAYCGLEEEVQFPIPKESEWCVECCEIAGKEDEEKQ